MVGCAPTAGRGRPRWMKPSCSAMLGRCMSRLMLEKVYDQDGSLLCPLYVGGDMRRLRGLRLLGTSFGLDY